MSKKELWATNHSLDDADDAENCGVVTLAIGPVSIAITVVDWEAVGEIVGIITATFTSCCSKRETQKWADGLSSPAFKERIAL